MADPVQYTAVDASIQALYDRMEATGQREAGLKVYLDMQKDIAAFVAHWEAVSSALRRQAKTLEGRIASPVPVGRCRYADVEDINCERYTTDDAGDYGVRDWLCSNCVERLT